MTDTQPSRLARPVIAIYWLALLGGLALFTATRSGNSALTAALWAGAVGGTVIGQYFALHNYRLWIVALAIAAVMMYCAPLVSSGEASTQLWLSFIPAALCGFLSLGDRGALAAMWFPTVIWMLTILDRSDRIAPDGPAAILLGGLAGMFVCFLCVRESRRVALWRSVAAEPLAPAQPAELLREPPGRQLARVGWWLTVGALTVAITVWLVPPLWRSETLRGPVTRLSFAPSNGLPCCPVDRDAATRSARVKEYLDLGLGHDEHAAAPREGSGCRRCNTAAPSTPTHSTVATGLGAAVAVPGSVRLAPPSTGPVVDVTSERALPSPVQAGHAVALDRRGTVSSVPVAPGAPVSPVPGWSGDFGTSTGVPVAASLPSARDPWVGGATPATEGAAWPSSAVTSPAASADPEPVAAPPGIPDPQHHAATGTSSALPRGAPPPAEAPSAPTAEPAPAPPAASALPHPPAGASGRPTAQSRAATDLTWPSLVHWLAFAVVAAVVFQLVRLGLYPLRRLVTLRHLRRPFWDETIAQRVSNAWQLALVGLRDAGWRTGPAEPPRELARRVDVDGLDRCATILERARHGVGLDAGDLAEMQTSADAAYRTARAGLGGVHRLLAWVRWPLT